MSWLSSPKVRLALIVNGLYFVSHFVAPSPPHARPQFFAQARESLAERAQRRARADKAPLPPPSAPSRATVYASDGLLHFSLNSSLTLVKRRGHMVVLSPWFSARAFPPAEPKSVLLSFMVYSDSDGEPCPGDCPLTIDADGEILWPERAGTDFGGHGLGRKRGGVTSLTSTLGDARVIKTMAAESFAAELPYGTFLDIISAGRIVVTLGADRVELTPDQIEALRDMHRSLQ